MKLYTEKTTFLKNGKGTHTTIVFHESIRHNHQACCDVLIAEYHEYLQRRYQARMARYYAALEQIKENGKRIAEEKRKANERVLQWKDGVDFVSTINNINKLAKLTENEK